MLLLRPMLLRPMLLLSKLLLPMLLLSKLLLLPPKLLLLRLPMRCRWIPHRILLLRTRRRRATRRARCGAPPRRRVRGRSGRAKARAASRRTEDGT